MEGAPQQRAPTKPTPVGISIGPIQPRWGPPHAKAALVMVLLNGPAGGPPHSWAPLPPSHGQ